MGVSSAFAGSWFRPPLRGNYNCLKNNGIKMFLRSEAVLPPPVPGGRGPGGMRQIPCKSVKKVDFTSIMLYILTGNEKEENYADYNPRVGISLEPR
jgi:hypothetical protein